MEVPRLAAIDHLVLTVADVDKSSDFYAQALGATPIIFGENRRALQIGVQKINLHPLCSPYPPVARRPQAGSADICFLSDTPLAQWQAHLKKCGVEIILGPVARTGATGPLISIYLYDPDGNLIEISNQSPG